MEEQNELGRVRWIGVRSERYEPLTLKDEVVAQAGIGLEGDHYQDPGGKRQITLIMQEDLVSAAADLGREEIDPGLVRRNVVISGVDLHRYTKGFLRIGPCLIEVTGKCHPCQRMEQNLGEGGLRSLAGRGGVTGRILEGGVIQKDDLVKWA
ncbi:MAG: MOSC domain-containing protein [Saprospiraceae bacterium]|nr:MOSC domain-containing protein [Saprospiraceae bacterium]